MTILVYVDTLLRPSHYTKTLELGWVIGSAIPWAANTTGQDSQDDSPGLLGKGAQKPYCKNPAANKRPKKCKVALKVPADKANKLLQEKMTSINNSKLNQQSLDYTLVGWLGA